ncbi:MAG: ROK family protein [Phycisphaerales bacterium JB063]
MATRTTALGIDIGAGSTKLALLAGEGGVLATAQSAAYTQPDLATLTHAIHEALYQPSNGFAIVADHIARVGLAVPGPVEPGQCKLPRCGNLSALEGVDPAQWVRGVVGQASPVRVMTDQHAAAFAAYTADPQPGRTLYLALGTGVGGAVLDEGQPLAFTRGTPGHLGHLDISGGNPDAPSTPAAGRGALEAYLGAPALRSRGLPLDDPARCANHPAMPEVIDAIARGIRIMFALYRMDHIVLLGGVAPVFTPVLDALAGRIRDGLTPVAPDDWTLSVGSVGLFAGAIGAARLAQQTAKH